MICINVVSNEKIPLFKVGFNLHVCKSHRFSQTLMAQFPTLHAKGLTGIPTQHLYNLFAYDKSVTIPKRVTAPTLDALWKESPHPTCVLYANGGGGDVSQSTHICILYAKGVPLMRAWETPSPPEVFRGVNIPPPMCVMSFIHPTLLMLSGGKGLDHLGWEFLYTWKDFSFIYLKKKNIPETWRRSLINPFEQALILRYCWKRHLMEYFIQSKNLIDKKICWK